MEVNNFSTTPDLLPDEMILEQLQKIISTQPFAVSEILRNFLTYIVKETIAGASESIKEYTIAIYVLNKPVNFKPYNDCGVRVHARRLRVALDQYYQEEGRNDDCIISIPKGRYVADFRSRKTQDLKKKRIAVMPFRYYDDNNRMPAFADMLGNSLNARLSQLPSFSVVPFHTTGLFASQTKSIKEITQKTGADYVLAGSIFQDAAGVRVFAELVDGLDETQLWSEMKKFTSDSEGLFELGDRVVHCLMTGMARISALDLISPDSIHQEPHTQKPCISRDLFVKKKTPVVFASGIYKRVL